MDGPHPRVWAAYVYLDVFLKEDRNLRGREVGVNLGGVREWWGEYDPNILHEILKKLIFKHLNTLKKNSPVIGCHKAGGLCVLLDTMGHNRANVVYSL